MLKLLPFEAYADADARAKLRFDTLWLALMVHGTGAAGRDARKQGVRIMAAFRGISERLPDAPSGVAGRNAITLRRDGGELALSADDARKLVALVDAVAWKGDGLDHADEVVDWIEALPEVTQQTVAKVFAKHTRADLPATED